MRVQSSQFINQINELGRRCKRPPVPKRCGTHGKPHLEKDRIKDNRSPKKSSSEGMAHSLSLGLVASDGVKAPSQTDDHHSHLKCEDRTRLNPKSPRLFRNEGRKISGLHSS